MQGGVGDFRIETHVGLCQIRGDALGTLLLLRLDFGLNRFRLADYVLRAAPGAAFDIAAIIESQLLRGTIEIIVVIIETVKHLHACQAHFGVAPRKARLLHLNCQFVAKPVLSLHVLR